MNNLSERFFARLADLMVRLRGRYGKWTISLFVLSAVCFVLSLGNYSSYPISRETARVQKALLNREAKLQKYVDRALKISPREWLDFEDFPEDMVLYKYNADTIQSWVNLFPLNNDEVDLTPLWYRLHDMNNMNLYNNPLAYLSDGEQYVNLGSAWYVVKTFKENDVKIVSGILVKTEYVTQNSALQNSGNVKLRLNPKYDTVPVYADDGNVIYGRDGTPLFSIVDKTPFSESPVGIFLKWISLMLLLSSMFFLHSYRRDIRSLTVTLIVLSLSLGTASWMVNMMDVGSILFSPTLYADSRLFGSLAHLLMNHLLVFLTVAAVFMYRKGLVRAVLSASRLRKWCMRLTVCLFILCYAAYIHITLFSVIANSSIVLELFKIDQLTVWSFVVYASYAMLYAGLLLCLYLAGQVFPSLKNVRIMSWKGILVFLGVITAYTFYMVSSLGFAKEFNENKVWTDRLAAERDISLEVHLRRIENQIYADPLIRLFMNIEGGNNIILNRLTDQYLWAVAQKYDVRITICRPHQSLQTENYPVPVDCHDFFFNDIISKYGVRLHPDSPFWYLNTFRNQISYIGVFTIVRDGVPYELYIEMDSKSTSDAVIGYPALLLDVRNRRMVPQQYSYARYLDGKLVSSYGSFDYRAVWDTSRSGEGTYEFSRKDGYFHFINYNAGDGIVVLSRPMIGMYQYLMYFSYLFIFFGIILFGIVWIIRSRNRGVMAVFGKRSFRRKITVLLTSSLLFALAAIGAGSIEFIFHLTDNTAREQMKEKLQTVQTSLSSFLTYARNYSEINDMRMFRAMDGVSSDTKVDINLYDPHGRLIRSTKPEVFNKYLVSSRMNPKAYSSLMVDHKLTVIQRERIASMEYYSLYAPVFNINGNMVAIINIPYFTDSSGLRSRDSSSIIAAIINIYLLLLIATLFGGVTMANSVSRPITQISRRMSEMDISRQPQHIDYKGNDELGVLVRSYNKMVDDLEQSTRKLAQSEREQAWREMARQIAHEIKNPLTPMKLSIQHLVRMKKKGISGWEDRLEDLSESLIEQIDILSNTASEFSSFARFFNEDDTDFDLISVLHEQFLLFDNRDDISMDFVCSLENAPVRLKKSQITRAFVNLISNAVQALETRGEGHILIEVSERGGYYRVSVEDDGPGVLPQNRDKLFKPNFTTKSSGTGLGLAITRNIVEQSRGTIWYDTSRMGGACFLMELPGRDGKA